MHFAFAIVSLFPGGGLQRDCVDIAQRVVKLGHKVTIFTSRLSGGEFVKSLPVHILRNDMTTNHQRQRTFSNDFNKATAEGFDFRVGFDKLAGLDLLYCSDQSIYARTADRLLLRMLPRYSEFIRLENDCFAPTKATKILLLSETQLNEYWGAWRTEPTRLVMLPPTLVIKRRKPEYRTNGTREETRRSLNLSPNDWVWITIGVQPRTKGIDRSIRALQQFPNAHLLIIGLDEEGPKSKNIKRLALKLGVANQVKWLGHREDIPELMAAADIFIHPARYDTTGTVILEAIVNGLPAIATSVCGYAKHINTADAGITILEPFRQKLLNAALETARDPALREHWSNSGKEYGKHKSLYEGKGRATEIIIDDAQKCIETRSSA